MLIGEGLKLIEEKGLNEWIDHQMNPPAACLYSPIGL